MSAKFGTEAAADKPGDNVSDKSLTAKNVAKQKASLAEKKVARQTPLGREQDEAAKTEQPDMTAVDNNGFATPAQYEDDGWGDVPVQMREQK